jgi:hypothetical protein
MSRSYTSAASKAKAEAAWATAQRLQQFGYGEFCRELSIPMEFATHIVRGWEAAGKVRVIAAHVGTARKVYEVVPEHEMRFVAVPGDAYEQMWTAMRKLSAFSPVDIAAHCATAVTVEEARAYCRLLMAAGYMRVMGKAVPGKKEATYRLCKVTGVKAPREKRVRCLIDENLGTIAPVTGDAQ